jgi:hypothetical protein
MPVTIESIKDQNNSGLADSFAVLITAHQRSDVTRWPALNMQDELIHPFMRNYEYPMSACPLILSKSFKMDFKSLSAKLVPILYHAIKEYFKDDEQQFAEYLQEPAWLISIIKENSISEFERMCRYDIVICDGKPKVIEVNTGSNLGGWQHDCFTQAYLKGFEIYASSLAERVNRLGILECCMLSLKKSIALKASFRGKGNVLFYMMELPDLLRETTQSFLRSVYDKAFSDTSGKLIFFSDFDKVLVSKADLIVRYEDEVIDAICLPLPEGVTVPDYLMIMLTRSAVEGTLVMPDNPVFRILGNKLLFPLLFTPAVMNSLAPEQQTFVDTHIPWSANLSLPELVYEGRLYQTKKFILSTQEKWVIKKANSSMGRDVYLGCRMTADDWRSVVEHATSEPGWLVQQYCKPEPVLAVNEVGAIELFSLVWGVFDFGGQYVGSFVRGKNETTDSSGVINSACGAIEFIVFEEQPAKKLIKI